MVKFMNPTAASLVSAGTTDTLTAAQIASGIFVRSGATGAVSVTTDTATNIILGLGPNASVGQTFMLIYANLNTSSGAVTMAGGVGVTTVGTLTIPIAGLRLFVGTITAVGSTPTVSLVSAFSIGSGVAA
jgi:hypothetical protein